MPTSQEVRGKKEASQPWVRPGTKVHPDLPQRGRVTIMSSRMKRHPQSANHSGSNNQKPHTPPIPLPVPHK